MLSSPDVLIAIQARQSEAPQNQAQGFVPAASIAGAADAHPPLRGGRAGGGHVPTKQLPIVLVHGLEELRPWDDPGLSAGRPARVARTFRYSVEYRIEETVTGVRAPALVVSGSADPITPPHLVRRVSELLPDGRLVVLDGAGHSIHGLRPRELARTIDGFLTELGETGGG